MRPTSSLAIVSATVMSLLLAACGDNAQTEGAAPTGDDGQTSPVDADSSSSLPDVVTIGATLPLTGSGAAWGGYISQAMNLAADEINSSGGVSGSNLEVAYEDHRAEAQPGASAFRKLAEVDGVPVVVTVNSGPVLAQLPIAQETQTVLFDAGTVSPQVREGGDYVFSNVPKADDEAAEHARFAIEELGFTRAAVLNRQDEAGTNFASVLKDQLTAQGAEVVFEDVHQPDATDFRPALARLDSSEAEVAFLPTYFVEAATLLGQAAEMDVDVTWITYSTVLNPAFLEALGDAAADITLYASTLGWDPEDPNARAQEFISAYEERFDESPEFYGANAYDAVYVIAGAMASCECYDADGIADALLNLPPYQGVTGETAFDSEGMVVKPILWYEVQDGGSLESL